jgi:hypothetical protein
MTIILPVTPLQTAPFYIFNDCSDTSPEAGESKSCFDKKEKARHRYRASSMFA